MIGQIYIQSDPAILSFTGGLGRYDIRTERPVVHVETRKGEYRMENNGAGTLEIDMSLTNDAIDGGSPESFWHRIYSQYKQIAVQNMERIVERGNTIGDLRIKQNPMPDFALEDFVEGPPDLQAYGPALPNNTKFSYTPADLNIEYIPEERNVDVQLTKPAIEYHREYVRYKMEQYPKVTIIPPAIDMMG
ncbi:DUF6470 family protein [Cohnella massiliensis]|uniref:DUF6470 family protein n=1 Tax=Cohnella massiliensis TaxID=1816691 RepID=UPI0009BA9ADB|nr:DUF6470 family protein [Cohnella massiliensis]